MSTIAGTSTSKPATPPTSNNGHGVQQPSEAMAKLIANQAGKGDKPIVFVNGRYVPKSEATVSVYDHGLLYGDGIFEGIRVYRGRIFMCGQHMDRLWASAEGIQMEIPISREEMVEVMRECIRLNGLTDAYIRLVVTRGAGTLGLDPRKCPLPGIVCIADQIALYPPELYRDGMKVVVAKRPRIPVEALDPRIKSLNYLNNILAKTEAIAAGCLEAIMLNMQGYVCECTGDNIFAIKGGKVFTPPSSAGALEGITRRFVIERLCPDTKTACEEKMMRIEEFLTADEVFLTGSAAEIISVTGIERDGKVHTISKGEGPVTKKLRERFRAIVTSEHVPED
jgi:branched-chain amino acid aminotransferase